MNDQEEDEDYTYIDSSQIRVDQLMVFESESRQSSL